MNGEESSIKTIASILKGVAGRIIVVALLVLVSFIVINFGFRFGYSLFCADSVEEAPGTDVEIVVEKGETIDELAEKLFKDKVIPNELAFRVQARLYHIGFYPGTYKINTSMSTKEILKLIDMTEQEYADSLALEASSEDIESDIIVSGDEGSQDNVNASAVEREETEDAADAG